MAGVRLEDPTTLAALALRIGGDVDDAVRETRVSRVASPGSEVGDDALLVVTSARVLESALEATNPLLISSALADRVPVGRRWVHSHADWALAELLGLAERPALADERPAAGARIDPGAELAPGVRVGAGAVVLSGAVIGAGSVIGPNAVIYGGSVLGRRVEVGPLAVIGRPGFGFVTGPAGQLVRMPQLGGVVIEDDVEIGALATIDAGTLGPTRIGRGAKLDAHVHVGHNVEIGPGTLVAAQAGFAGSVRVGPGVLIGGQAGIKDHVEIGAGARVAAKSGVIGDVPAGAVVAGFPARPRFRWLRAMSKLMRLAEEE